MKNFIPFLAFVAFFISCGHSIHKKEVLDHRKMRNEQFKDPNRSPLTKADQLKFRELAFFEWDENYRVNATLNRAQFPKYLSLYPSSDVKQIHVEVGKLEFTLNNKTFFLNAYKTTGQAKHILFIPFKDRTCTKSTYGGGRYVEAKLESDSIYVLDFNYAYHPFCVYNEKYTCAICPIENALDIAIEAGERLPKDYSQN